MEGGRFVMAARPAAWKGSSGSVVAPDDSCR